MSGGVARIVVIGVSASGKSVFARELSQKTGLPLVHMDVLMWKPGWQYVGDEQVVEMLQRESEKAQWVIEGYIATAARAGLFAKADIIIYLDYPGWLCAWRYIKRWWWHRNEPRPEMPGSPERFSLEFLWLVFTKGEARSLDEQLETGKWNDKMVTLKSPREASDYLASL